MVDKADSEDRILGTKYVNNGRYGDARIVREVKPSSLSLFDWRSSLKWVTTWPQFEDQCYWFAKIICDAVIELSEDNCVDNDTGSDINNQLYERPPNSYLSRCPRRGMQFWLVMSRTKYYLLCCLNFLKVEYKEKGGREELRSAADTENARCLAAERPGTLSLWSVMAATTM